MLSETVRLFLDSLGREDEYEYYVRKFQSAESDCFAIICPDFDCLQQSGAAMELALRHLLRLDLVPALLLSGPRARAMFTELSEREIPVDAVEAALGTDAVRAGVGRSGEAGRIPVIVHEDSSLLPALRHAQPLVARRLHIVRMRGALADSAGEDIAFYRINDSSPAVDPADETVLELAVNLLENRTLHVSITSPLNLLKEIFTIKGAGTVVRYGSRIEEYSGADAVDRERLRALLARSFERGLRNEEFLDRATSLYLESEYQGAILLGADAPAINAWQIADASSALEHDLARVISLAEDGGFVLFGSNADLSHYDWSGVPYGSPDTAMRFLDEVGPGLPLIQLESHCDLDTVDDLQRLAQRPPTRPTSAQQRFWQLIPEWLADRR